MHRRITALPRARAEAETVCVSNTTFLPILGTKPVHSINIDSKDSLPHTKTVLINGFT